MRNAKLALPAPFCISHFEFRIGCAERRSHRQHRRLELQSAAAERGDAIVVNDIPLLFEALDPTQFDAVVLVDAPVPVRRTRLRLLRGLSNQDADRMIAAQMSAARKRAQSQYVIENAGSLAELDKQAKR